MIKITSNKVRWAISTVLALLILFGTYRNVFSLAAFLGCCLMVFFCDKESTLLQLFFVMPMANIFKFAPGVQSFFTVLLLLYVVLHLVLPRKATLLIMVLAIYIVVGELLANQFNLFRTIKLICNILFMSSVLNSEVKIKHNEIFLSFICGNLIASVFGLMDSNFFKIVDYVGVMEFTNADMEIDVSRFTGLYTDPNYYAISMIISICLLIVLYLRNEMSPFVMGLFAVPIIYFLILTYSKSAILMVLVTFLFLLYVLFKKKKYVTALVLIALVLLVVILAFSGAIPALEVVVSRFLLADKGSEIDVNALTTGRFNLWFMYIKFLLSNIKAILFGIGISAPLINGWAAHNTYIDVVYYLGVFGGLLLFAVLFTISVQSVRSSIKRNIINYSILICILIMYFFLGELFYFDPPFHISLAFMVLNLPLDKSSVNSLNSDYQEELI